jgi:serine/threonine-protein kinase
VTTGNAHAARGVPPHIGDCVAGKYRVEKVIGEGGMGIVVAAMHLGLDERVALKFLRCDVPLIGVSHDRFQREARVAAKLQSEHVARVLDCDTLPSGVPYIVIEYLEGSDLARRLDSEGPLAACDAVDLMMQAAEAIAEAHAKGIVHRDLKPANIFVARRDDGSECVKLLDFGIAKLFDTEDDSAVTETSAMLGSVRYMAPEQLRSARTVTGRADIWAFGVVLYELLAGKTPFERPSRAETSAAVLHDAPTPLVSYLEVDAELAAAIHACLAKQPAERPPTIAALAEQLAPFGSDASRASLLQIERWRSIADEDARLDATDATDRVALVDSQREAGRTSAPSSVDALPRRPWPKGLVAVVAATLLVALFLLWPRAEAPLGEPAGGSSEVEASLTDSTAAAPAPTPPPTVAPPPSSASIETKRDTPLAAVVRVTPHAAASTPTREVPSAKTASPELCPDPFCARK